MSELENQTNPGSPKPEEQEIDLIELAQKVWAERKWILKVCGIALLIGLIVAFSIPKEYTTKATLAPESTTKSSAGSMGALAAMAGINIGSGTSEDALSPELYPDIVSSTPFLTDLFNIEVTTKKGDLQTTLYDYLDEHQKGTWWGAIFSFPFKALGWGVSLFRSDEPEPEKGGKINPFMLTLEQAGIAESLSKLINVTNDKKTGVTTISVTMQDPLISATVTDTVLVKLQKYITEYRTNKARHDLSYTEKLYEEAKQDYHIAQQNYARFVDGNLNVVMQRFKAEQERLQNEMSLAYTVYNQVAQQLQMAKAKVQEITPVYTVVEPATVPLQAAKPNKMMILIGFIFLAGIGAVGWILFVKDLIKSWKTKKEDKL